MTSLHSNDRPPEKPWLAIGVVVALLIIAANLAGYLIYSSNASKPDAADPEPAASNVATPTTSLAEEQREAGVRALRAGKYAKAIASFEAALKLDPKVADAPVLLDVAKNLQRSEAGADEPATVAKTAPRPPPTREPERVVERVVEKPPPRARRTRRTTRRKPRVERAERVEEPVEAPASGTLVVTTEPTALDVEVDGGETERSPVTLSLEPGNHVVRIRKGDELLEERRVEIESGRSERVFGDFTDRLASPPDPTAISKAKSLDLVALIDRDKPKDSETTEPRGTPPTPAGTTLTPTPVSSTPRVVVFWPGRSSGGLQQSMRADMRGVDVRVVTRTGDLRRALTDPTDALMAAPYVLRQNGLAPQLSAKSTSSGRYLAVSLGSTPVRSTLASQTIGVVDELGRKGMPIFVKKLLGSSRTPILRRVTKVEDLLPLLQFSIAKTVLVKDRDFSVLESRTEQRLYTLPISAKATPLAVAFADGGRRTVVERAVRGLGSQAKQSLGVESWSNR